MSAAPRPPAPHVLVVEDSALAAAALCTLLEQTGHKVSLAGTVADAVRVAADDPPDVMLLDLTLPDGDGLQVLGQLAARGRAPRFTAALTGHEDSATARRCHEAGCQAVLVKPVPTKELLRKVRAWLG